MNYILKSKILNLKSIYRWLTATRLRKILSSILASLILFTSIRFLFLKPKEVKAADVLIKLDEGYGTTSAVHDTNSTVSAGSITNAVWKREEFCKTGKCLYFDGTGDYISFVDDANLDMGAGETVTIEGWFRTPDITSGTRTLISKFETTGGDGGYKIYINSSGQVIFGIDNINTGFPTDSVTSTAAYDDNVWHHFAAVKNGATSITLYIDANSVGTPDTSIQNDVSNNDSFYIGRFESDTAQDYSGLIDEVKVLRSARTADQIKADFTGGTPSRGTSASFSPDNSYISNKLVGFWAMDDSTTPSVDSSGNGNSGTWTGNVVKATGKFGGGTMYDGTGDYISISDSTALSPTDEITISATASPSASIATKALVVKDTSYRMVTDASGYPLCQIHNGTSWQTAATSSTALSLLTWKTVTCVHNKTQTQVYVNGVLSGTSDVIASISDNANALRIGSDAGGTYGDFNGNIDEVRIFSRALSPDEGRRLADWVPGPNGYWKMDENTGTTTLFDSSSNGFNGTMENILESDWKPGKFGSSLYFDAVPATTQDNVNIYSAAFDTSFDPLQGSLMAWVKVSNASVWTDATARNAATLRFDSNRQILIGKASASNQVDLQYEWHTGGNTCNGRYLSGNYSDTNWHHLAITWDQRVSQAVHAYIDGVEMSLSPNTYTVCDVGTTTLSSSETVIGARNTSGTDPWSGQIDDVRFYNYARTFSQITEDMNAGHPAPGSPIGSSIGFWKFDEGTDNTCSGGSNDVCNSGSQTTNIDGTSTATRTNSGKIGRALSFDGTDDVVNLGTNAAVDDLPNSGMSVSAWIYPTSMGEASQGVIMAKNSGATPSAGWLLQFAGTNALKFSVDGSTDLVRQTSNSMITLNAWNHVSLYWDGVITTASSVHIFVNGNEVSYATTTNGASRVADGASSLYIGNDSSGASTFAGIIDEVKLFNSSVTSDQVKLLYNQGANAVMGAVSTTSDGTTASWSAQREYCPPGNTETNCGSGDPSPVGYWKLDENTGTAARDISGNNNNLSFTSTPVWEQGKVGQSLNFDGVDDNLSNTNVSSILDQTGNMTITAWLYRDTTTSDDAVISKQGDGENLNYEIYINDTDNVIRFNWQYGAALNEVPESTVGLTNSSGAWTHIAISRDTTANQVWFYENGTQLGTVVTYINDPTGGTTTPDFLIGDSTISGTRMFDGKIDDVKVFNYIRTPAQIAWDYNRGKPVGWWKFDENTGTSANDSSGLTNTVTLSATSWSIGKFNYSWNGDGTKWAAINDDTDFDFGDNQSFSISAWVKSDDDDPNPSSNEVLINKHVAGTNADGYRIYFNTSGQLVCEIDDDITSFPEDTASSATDYYDLQWHHVVCIRDITGDDLNLYVDGKFVDDDGNLDATTDMSNADNLSIGDEDESDDGDEFFGDIDDVRIFRYALSSEQIKLLYNENATVRFGPLTGTP